MHADSVLEIKNPVMFRVNEDNVTREMEWWVNQRAASVVRLTHVPFPVSRPP